MISDILFMRIIEIRVNYMGRGGNNLEEGPRKLFS
jgi:hypothetical protein